jgi:hypothetical protein
MFKYKGLHVALSIFIHSLLQPWYYNKNGTSNYFKRGKHANEFHDKFDDPLYLPKISKMQDLNSHLLKFLLVVATIMK